MESLRINRLSIAWSISRIETADQTACCTARSLDLAIAESKDKVARLVSRPACNVRMYISPAFPPTVKTRFNLRMHFPDVTLIMLITSRAFLSQSSFIEVERQNKIERPNATGFDAISGTPRGDEGLSLRMLL